MMKRTHGLRTGILAVGAVLVLGAAAAATTMAQTATPPQPTPSVRPTPGIQGASAAQLAPDRREKLLEAVAAKLGVSVDQLKQAFQEAQQELRQEARQQLTERFRTNLRQSMGVAADAIGITPQQLRQELPGESLSDVAKAHGAEPQVVKNALVDELNRRIDGAAAEGKLPQKYVDRLKQRVSERVDTLMTRSVPARPQDQAQPRS